MSNFTKSLSEKFQVSSFLGFDLKRGKIIAQIYGITACFAVIGAFTATLGMVVSSPLVKIVISGLKSGGKYETFFWLMDLFKTITSRESDCELILFLY